MARFRLGNIPVEVHPTHLLFSALVGSYLVLHGPPVADTNAWPYTHLLRPDASGYTRTAALATLGWMGVIFVTALGYELGRALTGRLFGCKPSIELQWLGGLTRANAPLPLRWYVALGMAVAGPLSGVALMGGAALGLRLGGGGEVLRFLLTCLLLTARFWTLFNLLPIPPLDGGRILSTVATRLFGRVGFLGAQFLSLVLCLAIVALALVHQLPGPGLLFGLYGMQVLRLLLAVARGELKVSTRKDIPEPLERELREARAALAEGRLEDARQKGLAVLEADESGPELSARAHHLLGWVALKKGQGRMALDHFSQVQRHPVETHALAAAFSLLGDEPRAIALWELAWHETQDRTVLHEYAGALIRAERIPQALRLPGVDPELAFSCAERTLFIRGAYSEAAHVAEAGLLHAPTAPLAYAAACAHARARHKDDAVRLLRRASELGFEDAHYAASDEDLAPLHGHPGFEHWLQGLQKSASA